jgi:hypothetical protein
MVAYNINFCATYVDEFLLINNTKLTKIEFIQSHINKVPPNNYFPLSLNTTIA